MNNIGDITITTSLVMLLQAFPAAMFSSCLYLGHFAFQEVKYMLSQIQIR